MLNLSRALLLLTSVLVSCTSRQVATNSSVPATERSPAANQANLTYDKFTELLNQYQPQTVDETLSLLKKYYPDYLSFHTFIYQSFSLQGTSLAAPRAMVFGRDSKFIMTFGGDRKLKGYDVIETIHFKDDTKEFEFREVQFRKDKTEFTEDEIDPSKNFGISAVNGNDGKCLQCHSTPIRPNWDRYPFLPGTYGSHGDFENAEPTAGKPVFKEIAPNDSSYQERQQYLSFMSHERNEGRYQFLPPLSREMSPEVSGDVIERPNFRFTDQLSKLNGERIANTIKNTPKLFNRRYAIVSAVLCENVQYAVGSNGQPNFNELNRPLSVSEAYALKRINLAKASNTARYRDIFKTSEISRMNRNSPLSDVVVVGRLIDIAGRDTVGNWSLPVGADSNDFTNGFGNAYQTSLKSDLLPALIRTLTPELMSTKAYDLSSKPKSLNQITNPALGPICEKLNAQDRDLNR